MVDEEYAEGQPRDPLGINDEFPRVVSPESAIELQQFVINPDAKIVFDEEDQEFPFADITKDFTVSNIQEWEKTILWGRIELAGHAKKLGMKNYYQMQLRDIYGLLNLARSRAGFERRMLATTIQQQSRDISLEQKKKGFKRGFKI